MQERRHAILTNDVERLALSARGEKFLLRFKTTSLCAFFAYVRAHQATQRVKLDNTRIRLCIVAPPEASAAARGGNRQKAHRSKITASCAERTLSPVEINPPYMS